MPKKQLHISYDTLQSAQTAMDLLGRSTSDWYDRIETAQISPTYSEDLPELEGFELPTTDWDYLEQGGSHTLNQGVLGTITNPYPWYRVFHSPPGNNASSGTGPNEPHSGSYYVYTETSGIRTNKYFSLERDIPAATGVSTMNFYFHMHGGDMDNQTTQGTGMNQKAYLSVEISSDNGANWFAVDIRYEDDTGTMIGPVQKIEGEQQTAPNLPFRLATAHFPSSMANESFKVRFFTKSPDGDGSINEYEGDISIDEITFHRPPPETKYLITVSGKEYDILYANFLTTNPAKTALGAKQLFIAREYKIDDEEKAINGWTSVRSENETKTSLRKATKEYMESGPQDTAKRQQYIDLGGTKLL